VIKLLILWQTAYIVIIFVAALISIGIAAIAWHHRAQTGAALFAGMMLAVAEWLVTSGCVSLSQTPEHARWWVDPRYFGLTAMLAFFITYIVTYSGHGKWLTKPRLIFFFSVPLVTQLIIETNAFHHLFLVSVGFSRDGNLMGIDSVVYGPLFWVHTVYSYLLVMVGVFLTAQMAIRSFRLYRQQAMLMILGIIPPVATSVIDAFLLIPGLKHPLSPIGFAVMGTCFAAAMFWRKMLEIVPVARDTVIESMSDAMIVLDIHDKVVDVNPAARQFLGLETVQIIGKPIQEVFRPWDDLLFQSEELPASESEICLGSAGAEKFYDLRISPLKIQQKKPGGRIIILRDITQRKQSEIQLKALQEQCYEQSIHDPLTGLYNRRFLAESIKREAANAVREQHPIGIAIIDIDYFKQVNDTYGHEAGDMELIHLAEILSRLSRAGDYVFRYGGEEFLIMMPDTSLLAAVQMAERCRQHIANYVLNYADSQISITVSIGVAALLPGESGYEAVLKAADDGLYQAKEKGRNCVVAIETGAAH
jgi:diguanylate cyclase (GGDEF)-like protein/PAS domain S-box-containing protein